MVKIISADEIKETIANYTPDKAEQFHNQSAKLADKQFEVAIKSSSNSKVILMSGGTASGKTEFLVTQLSHKKCVVMDATLYTELGAGIKIKKIIKEKKKPVIYAVIPDDIKRAFIAFLNRDRKFSDTHFYRTHSGSRRTLLWVAKIFPTIEIHIIESSYTKKKEVRFTEIIFKNRKELISYLTGKLLSEADIISILQSQL